MDDTPRRPGPADKARVMTIVEAVSGMPLDAFDAWRDLQALSTRTELDGIAVDPVGVRVSETRFDGLATVYVGLIYGTTEADKLETSDAFPAAFEGHFEGTRPVIDRVTVNTRHFFK